jgi:hypothetical protein
MVGRIIMKEQKPSVGIEIALDKPDSFLLIKETLTRIGIPSKKNKTLFQTCHILHKQGKYFIVHFKELFLLDGKTADISEDDYRRRNTITKFLNQWNLCSILNKIDIEFLSASSEIKIVPFKEKKEWTLLAKYTIGNRPKNPG